MNHHEITEVRRTWKLASSHMPLFAQMFHTRLQSINHHRRALSADDAEANRRLLLRLVGIAVNGLNQPRILFPLLETLGRQNALRIINARQSGGVIRALLWALKASLGPSFNGTARHAWIAGYRAVAQAMATGMAEAASRSRWNASPEMYPLSRSRPPTRLALTPQPNASRWYA